MSLAGKSMLLLNLSTERFNLFDCSIKSNSSINLNGLIGIINGFIGLTLLLSALMVCCPDLITDEHFSSLL